MEGNWWSIVLCRLREQLQRVEHGLDVGAAHGAGALNAGGDVTQFHGLHRRYLHVVADFVGRGDALGAYYVFHNL